MYFTHFLPGFGLLDFKTLSLIVVICSVGARLLIEFGCCSNWLVLPAFAYMLVGALAGINTAAVYLLYSPADQPHLMLAAATVGMIFFLCAWLMISCLIQLRSDRVEDSRFSLPNAQQKALVERMKKVCRGNHNN